jgi:hypothetical protein
LGVEVEVEDEDEDEVEVEDKENEVEDKVEDEDEVCGSRLGCVNTSPFSKLSFSPQGSNACW